MPTIPIRCGNASFGLVHIIQEGHLQGDTDAYIQTTFTYGEQAGPGKKVLMDGSCNQVFRVIYGYNAYNGTDQLANPIGVVNAYKSYTAAVMPAAMSKTTNPTTNAIPVIPGYYRTDCPSYKLI